MTLCLSRTTITMKDVKYGKAHIIRHGGMVKIFATLIVIFAIFFNFHTNVDELKEFCHFL
jgi:hypothetical protein